MGKDETEYVGYDDLFAINPNLTLDELNFDEQNPADDDQSVLTDEENWLGGEGPNSDDGEPTVDVPEGDNFSSTGISYRRGPDGISELETFYRTDMNNRMETLISIKLPDGQKLCWEPHIAFNHALEIDIKLTNIFGQKWTNQGTLREEQSNKVYPMPRTIPKNIEVDTTLEEIEEIMLSHDETRYDSTSYTLSYKHAREIRIAGENQN
jgi:hypothetical protein